MFSNMSKPAFGATQQTPSFGFGSTANQNPFGQTQLFGKPATSTFGSATPAFGQATASNQLFQTSQQQPSLFQNASTPSFGATAQPGGFGSNLFGSAPSQPGSSGLFGSNTFGQQNKTPAFGFGASTSQSGGLFGQSQAPTQNTSIFQPAVSSSMFGSSFGQPMQSGTVVKFVPVTGTDTMQKGGIPTTINTKHHCITCMKEYEGKSLEELRWEDYQSGRKGPQQQTGFGVTPFGATAPQTQPIFGQTENKPVFGQTGFGQNTTGFSMQNQQNLNLFQKPSTGFGTTTKDSNAFGFNAVGSNPFGASSAAKPFGGIQTQPLFGSSAPQQNTAFGSSLFGQPSTQSNTSLFGKPAQPTTAFNTGQTGFTFGQPASTQNTGLFQQQKPNTGFSLFGQSNTTTPAFGQQTGFGQTNQNTFGSGTFGKPSMTFGQPAQPSFGTGLGLQQGGSSLFGNTSKPGGLFGNNNTTGSSLFTANVFQNNTGFNVQPQQQPQLNEAQNFDANTLANVGDPFGHKDYLYGLTPVKDKQLYRSTNPTEIQALLENSDKKTSINAKNSDKLRVATHSNKKQALFDEVTDKGIIEANCELRRSAKRLIIRKFNGKVPPKKNTFLSLYQDSDSDSEPLYKLKCSEPAKSPSPPSEPKKTNGDASRPNIFFKQNGDENNSSESETKRDNNTQTQFSDTNLASTSKAVQKLPAEENDSDEASSSLSSPKNATSPSDTCGVILKRPEYYMVPPLEDLKKYVNEEGRCIVKGLTIGRMGYGNVYFPDEVDITNFNLDELVHFRHREVIIYPDDVKKPPVGEGLNRHAQVTLDNIFPHDKKQNVVTDIDYLIKINFSDRLRIISERHDSVFKEYRPETGSWVFDVEHFSLYGIRKEDEKDLQVQDDSSDEDVVMEQQYDIEQKDHGVDSTKKTSPVSASDKQLNEANIEELKTNSQTNLPPIGKLNDLSSNEIAMEKSYSPYSYSKRYPKFDNDISLMKACLFEDETVSEMSEGDAECWRQYNNGFDRETITEESLMFEDKGSDDEYEYFVSVPISDITDDLDICKDLEKFNSFKVGWGAGLKFIASFKQDISDYYLFRPYVHTPVLLQLDCAENFLQDPFMNSVSNILGVFLKHCTINLNAECVPTIKIDAGTNVLLECRNFMRRMSLNYPENDSLKYYKDIFDLCDIFWGSGLNTESSRQRAFVKWLEIFVEDDVEVEFDRLNRSLKSSVAERVFVLLTGHKIQKATELANRANLHYLSLLIPQLSSSEMNKELMQWQINQWEDNMSVKHIDEIFMKLYMLLSGILSKSNINVCDGLDWKRALALHLWYVTPIEAPLKHAVQLYEKAFKTLMYASGPYPFYMKNRPENEIYDIIYHIIRMYSFGEQSIIKILDTATHTTDPNDFRLIWFLVQIFLSLKVGFISEKHLNYIHTKFAAQLEKLGQWKWAIFILLFIKDEKLKEEAVISTLRNMVNCDEDEFEDIEGSLINDFKVPSTWINTVKAHRAKCIDDHIGEFQYLALAHDYVECHDVSLRFLLPYLILTEQYEAFKGLLEPYVDNLKEVHNYKNGIGLLLDFVHVQDLFKLKDKRECYEMRSKLISVCQRIKLFPKDTKEQMACVAVMSKNCARLMKEMSGMENGHDFDSHDLEYEYLFVTPDY